MVRVTTDLAWTEDRATQRCDPSACPGAKTGVRAELRPSVPLLSCPLRDWPQGDKPSRHDAATRRTRCPHLPETRDDTDARPWQRCNAAMPAPRSPHPNDVQDRTNPAIDSARPGTTGSAKVVPSLTAADTRCQDRRWGASVLLERASRFCFVLRDWHACDKSRGTQRVPRGAEPPCAVKDELLC